MSDSTENPKHKRFLETMRAVYGGKFTRRYTADQIQRHWLPIVNLMSEAEMEFVDDFLWHRRASSEPPTPFEFKSIRRMYRNQHAENPNPVPPKQRDTVPERVIDEIAKARAAADLPPLDADERHQYRTRGYLETEQK